MTSSQNVKQAVVVAQTNISSSQNAERIALFHPDGTAVTLSAAQTGADVKLTGFTTGAAGALAATDSVNVALGKLQARIVALESA